MSKIVEECKLIGRAFEDQVANMLRKQGYEVFQDLYVPYHPGSDRYAQIDIVALNNKIIFTLECKCITGKVTGVASDKYWSWKSGGCNGKICNPLHQSYSHACALAENLGFYVPDFVVSKFPDVFPAEMKKIITVNDLDAVLSNIKVQYPTAWFDLSFAKKMLGNWTKTNANIRQSHALYVNRCRNGDIATPVRNFEGLPHYCIMVGDTVFYAFTDDGVHYGTENLNEAMMFDDEDSVFAMVTQIPDGEVCTLSKGGVELLSDIGDEFDGMTPDEIAYEIGARPW